MASATQWDGMTLQQRIATIRWRASLGDTAAQIANRLGTTRNAVGGLAFRHEIDLPTDRRYATSGRSAPTSVSPTAWKPLLGSTPRRLADAPADGCMWPASPEGAEVTLFCCESISEGRYCEHHHKRSRIAKHAYRLPEGFRATGAPPVNRTTVDEALASLAPGKQNRTESAL